MIMLFLLSHRPNIYTHCTDCTLLSLICTHTVQIVLSLICKHNVQTILSSQSYVHTLYRLYSPLKHMYTHFTDCPLLSLICTHTVQTVLSSHSIQTLYRLYTLLYVQTVLSSHSQLHTVYSSSSHSSFPPPFRGYLLSGESRRQYLFAYDSGV